MQATNPACLQSSACIINGNANGLSWRDAISLKDLPVVGPVGLSSVRDVRPLVAALPYFLSGAPYPERVNESIPSRLIDACGASFLTTCPHVTR